MPTYRIQTRRDSYANWSNSTQVLLEGEIAINTTDVSGAAIRFEASNDQLGAPLLIDQQCIKIGDGLNTWTNLNFVFAPGLNPSTTNTNNYAQTNSPSLKGIITLGEVGSSPNAVLVNAPTTVFDAFQVGVSGNPKTLTVRDEIDCVTLKASTKVETPTVEATNVTATGVVTAATVTADNLAGGIAPFLLPIGTVLPFAGPTAPAGFKLCDGLDMNTFDFKELHAVITNTYGGTAFLANTTDQSGATTTFKLPDLRGRVPAGSDHMNSGSAGIGSSGTSNLTSIGTALGTKGGSETHTLLTAEMPAHQHFLAAQASGSSSPGDPLSGTNTLASQQIQPSIAASNYTLRGTGGAATLGKSSSTGSGGSHDNVQPTIILNYMIKF